MMTAHYAAVMQGVKEMLNRTGHVANRRISGRGDFEIHHSGLLAELAVAKFLGVPMHTALTMFGDGGTDLEYNGRTIQVKQTNFREEVSNGTKYLVFNKLEDFNTNFAVLCTTDSPSSMRIDGVVSKKKFVEGHTTHDFTYGLRYVYPAKKLAPIEKLLEVTA